MKLDHINYVVPNVEKFVESYEKLGFKVTHTFDLHRKFVFMSNGDVTYEIFEDPSKEAYIGHVAYVSNDIQKDYNDLKSKGIEFITEIKTIDGLFDNGMEFFLFKGPNNETIEYCRKK